MRVECHVRCSGQVWDRRRRHPLHSFENKYPVLATCFTDGADAVISAGIDNTIKLWDLRRAELDMSLTGHSDSVTGLALSHDGPLTALRSQIAH